MRDVYRLSVFLHKELFDTKGTTDRQKRDKDKGDSVCVGVGGWVELECLGTVGVGAASVERREDLRRFVSDVRQEESLRTVSDLFTVVT